MPTGFLRSFGPLGAAGVALLAMTAGVASAQDHPMGTSGSDSELRAEAAVLGGPPPPAPPTEAQKLVEDLGVARTAALLTIEPMPEAGPWPSADPHDLEGTWIHTQVLETRMTRDMYGFRIPYTMAGAQTVVRRVKANDAGTPYSTAAAQCRPPGSIFQRDLHFPFQIFQTKDSIEFVFQEFHGRAAVLFDPKNLPAGKSYMGRSIGHWVGDTLVVETSDFKAPIWLDIRGNPLSMQGKLIERIRKVDTGDHDPYLEIVTTVVDPRYYTKAWSFVRSYSWRPNMTHFKEYNCEEQIGDPSVTADAGLLTESEDQR